MRIYLFWCKHSWTWISLRKYDNIDIFRILSFKLFLFILFLIAGYSYSFLISIIFPLSFMFRTMLLYIIHDYLLEKIIIFELMLSCNQLWSWYMFVTLFCFDLDRSIIYFLNIWGWLIINILVIFIRWVIEYWWFLRAVFVNIGKIWFINFITTIIINQCSLLILIKTKFCQLWRQYQFILIKLR